MFYLAFWLALITQVTQASPIIREFPRESFRSRSESTCDDINNCRTLWDIIWSCLSVLIACTWAALHRDIPPKGVSEFMLTLNRIWATVVAFFTPEFLAFMAVLELSDARKVHDEFRSVGWTQTHAFFANMGGFVLVKPGEHEYLNKGRVSWRKLKKLSDEGKVDLTTITREDIADKSKGDFFSKSVVILQTGWFIIQIISRFAEHLPVTELEIVTLAFAMLNFMTYGFWWNKPLNVQTPIPVLMLPVPLQHKGDSHHENNSTSSFRSEVQSVSKIESNRELKPAESGEKSKLAVEESKPVAADEEEEEAEEKEEVPHTLTPTEVFRELLSLLYKHNDDLFRPYRHVREILNKLSKSGTPTGVCMVLALITTTFGAIHLIAWDFGFPTPQEQLLWRISAMSITVVPVYMFLGRAGAVAIIDRICKRPCLMRRLLLVLATCTSTLPGALLYILARDGLIILAAMELRRLPYGAYQTVSWTSLIPHI